MKTGLVLRLIRFPQKTQCVFKVNPIGRFISAYGAFGLKNNALNDINTIMTQEVSIFMAELIFRNVKSLPAVESKDDLNESDTLIVVQ